MVADNVAWRDDSSSHAVVTTATVHGAVPPAEAKPAPLALPLKEFLECFPPPQTGRILADYRPDFDADAAFDLPAGAVLQFHRKVNPNVPLSFRDPWGGGGASRRVTVTLPLEFRGLFRLLPYDPASDDCSPDHIFTTVADLVKAFPVYVQANASFADTTPGNAASLTFKCGERFKLTRLVYEGRNKYLECRPIAATRLLLLPMSAVGNFTVLPDDTDYVLAELVAMATRRRRVRLTSGERHRVPGLPAQFDGDLYVEEADTFVEASSVTMPGLIIGLPHDIAMVVAPVDESFERGLLLNNFATNNRSLFPLVARVTGWQEETPILERHLVRPGVEIVIHGWTRQSKVLATCGKQGYAIPVTYQGKLRIRPAQYHGVTSLVTSRPVCRLRVTHVDLAEPSFPLASGDVIRLKRVDSVVADHVRCERVSTDDRPHSSEVVRLPATSTARFEEVLDESKCAEFSVGALLDPLADGPIDVTLTRPSADRRLGAFGDDDLPAGCTLTLCDVVVEPAVYVSVRTPDAPAFHVPLRSLLRVTFVEQLERESSPLLTRCAPRLSTLDRCVETLPPDVFAALRPGGASDVPMASFGAAASVLDNHAAATPWNGSCSPQHPGSSFFSTQSRQSEQKGRYTPSIVDSEISTSKSLSFGTKLRNKLRRSKSTDKIPKLGKTDLLAYAPTFAPEVRQVALTAVVNGHVRLQRNLAVTQSLPRPMAQRLSPQSAVQSSEASPAAVTPVCGALPAYATLPAGYRSAVTKAVQFTERNAVNELSLTNGHHQRNGNGNGTSAVSPVNGTSVSRTTSLSSRISQTTTASAPENGGTRPGMHSGKSMNEDNVSEVGFNTHLKFSLQIPDDGNLYDFSAAQMAELLGQLRVDMRGVDAVKRDVIDGRRFARMTQADLHRYGLLNAIVVHFRRATRKRTTSNFML